MIEASAPHSTHLHQAVQDENAERALRIRPRDRPRDRPYRPGHHQGGCPGPDGVRRLAGRDEAQRRADEAGAQAGRAGADATHRHLADGSARGGTLPMRSPRLVPYWSVHETLGVDARNAPVKIRRRRIRLSRAGAWSCGRCHPAACAALGSTDVEGSDPPVRGPGAGSDAGVFSHPCPRPLGVAPVQISLAGRLPSADVQVGESSTHRCSQARVLPVKQAVPSRRGRTRRRGDNAARTRQGPATHLGSPCARTRDHPGRHLAAGTAERPAALADAQDRRDHGR